MCSLLLPSSGRLLVLFTCKKACDGEISQLPPFLDQLVANEMDGLTCM